MFSLDDFRRSEVYDSFAERLLVQIDFNNEEEVRSKLPRYLERLDSYRRDAKFYPSLMIFLYEHGYTQFGAVFDTVYPDADVK